LEIFDGSDKNIKIIDLGAGTGYAAIELKKHGFTNIDGLDVSSEMLKKKDAYRNYICEAVTEKRLDIPTGAYDVVLSVGAVTSGYIKSSAFDEILRLAKPG
jgi:ubiquinone/menaquinone biosynthesis C-methylase UbiE